MRVKIESKDMKNFLETEKDYWDRFGGQTLNHLRDEGLTIYREEAPKGPTGRLERSLFSEIEENKVRLGYDLSIAPHAEIVDGHGRTARSEGRYVPAIDRRLVRISKRNPTLGTHPGSKRTPFTERTIERLERLMDQILKRGVRR